MPIRAFLDVSTGHLTANDAALLALSVDRRCTLPMDTMAYGFGWIVSTAALVTEDGRDAMVERIRACGLSETFIAIAVEAGRKGCWLLRFEADEELDPNLPAGGYGLDAE